MEKYPNKVLLHFKRGELLYDCRTLGYVAGDVTQTDDPHVRHQLQDIGEDGNVDWVTRVLALGVARCREALFPYSKQEVASHVGMDDELESPDAYVIELNVPADFSQTTVTLLTNLTHMLLVYMVMEQWVSLTNPDDSAGRLIWKGRIEETMEQIEDAKNGLCGVRMIRISPFH